ncbi:MAG: sulfite exporter TauE/SafE family protein [Acidimicrobiia bacterium]|nr:sulfite exporter TauE/SafE family protein [Acidimicrobiia bacterium]
MPVSAPDLIAALIITAFAASVQSSAGVGFAIVSVPLLSLLDERLAPVPQILVVLPMVISMAWRERHAIDLDGVGWILVGRLVGAGIGLALIKMATETTLDVLVGLAVLAGVIILATGAKVRRTPVTQTAAGTVASVTSLVASMGGPPLALLYHDAKGETIRASLATVFIFGVTLTIAIRAASGEISRTDVEVALWLLPAMLVGLRMGRHLAARLEGAPLRRIILALSAAAAVGLLARAAF